jgi:hypothetical protein
MRRRLPMIPFEALPPNSARPERKPGMKTQRMKLILDSPSNQIGSKEPGDLLPAPTEYVN